MNESKRNLKAACEAAVATARPSLREHPGWMETISQFLMNVVSVLTLTLGAGGNRWAIFYDYEATFNDFEREVVNHPSLASGA